MDRYRMLPGDLTVAQIAIVGQWCADSAGLGGIGGPGDGAITWGNESVLFFQNLTASGFLSCGACMTVGGHAAPTINNSLDQCVW